MLGCAATAVWNSRTSNKTTSQIEAAQRCAARVIRQCLATSLPSVRV